jgi:hypothetical protein
MKPFSVNDPKNTTSLKVKVIEMSDKTINVHFEVLLLNADNKTLNQSADYFMSVEDFDYLYYLYEKQEIPSSSFYRSKGKNGTARGMKVTNTLEMDTPGHLVILVANGTGPTGANGFTTLKKVSFSRMINLSKEQSIKMFKYIERSILINSLKQA